MGARRAAGRCWAPSPLSPPRPPREGELRPSQLIAPLGKGPLERATPGLGAPRVGTRAQCQRWRGVGRDGPARRDKSRQPGVLLPGCWARTNPEEQNQGCRGQGARGAGADVGVHAPCRRSQGSCSTHLLQQSTHGSRLGTRWPVSPHRCPTPACSLPVRGKASPTAPTAPASMTTAPNRCRDMQHAVPLRFGEIR